MSLRRPRLLGPLVALVAALPACAPDLGEPDSLVDRTRLLAVQSEPPEARPGERATYRLLLAGPTGALNAASAIWSVCTAPLPLTETGAVSSACLGNLTANAQGDAVPLSTSADACSRFGPVGSPDVQRAREADATGGYYQPIRVQLGDAPGSGSGSAGNGVIAFALQRLRCPLAQASFAVSQEYERRYPNNRNPIIGSIASPTPLDAVPAGAMVDLSIDWDPASLEVYPVLDPAALALVDRRETFSVSWFVTGGALDQARTGATPSANAPSSSSNRWRAPAQPGPVYLWVVVRDDRGGSAWASAQANVVEVSR